MKQKRRYTRREFLQVAASAAAGAPVVLSAACGGGSSTPPPIQPPGGNLRPDAKVSIVSCTTYDATPLEHSLTQAFDLIGGVRDMVNGKTVTVKVNLTCSGAFVNQFGLLPGESYITDGRTAIALASILLSNGARKVRFIDSVPFVQPLEEVLTSAQWDVATLLALGNIELENTRNLGSGTQYARRNVPSGGYLFSYFELNHSFSDTDVFVSLAKMKQHQIAGITLSMKNLFGSTPNALYGTDAATSGENATGYRGNLHGDGSGHWVTPLPPGARTDRNPQDPGYNIPRIVADLCAARPVHLAIIDGIRAMSGGEGPWAPNAAPTAPGVIIAGVNPVSTDAVAMAVMGYSDPRGTRGTRPFLNADNHLLLGEQAGIGTAELAKITVSGMTIAQALYPYPG